MGSSVTHLLFVPSNEFHVAREEKIAGKKENQDIRLR